KIKFTETFDLDLVDGFVEPDALGFGAAYRVDDKRAVRFWPKADGPRGRLLASPKAGCCCGG
ncbi:MAG TPA: hypothetical protein VF110_10140, partial [Burkholderiales bacterium]